MHQAWEIARQCIHRAQEKQKYYYDRNAAEPTFSVGDRVWMHDPAVAKGRVSKLTPHWKGPYRILTTKFPIVLVCLCMKPNSPTFWVHVNRLKPCFTCIPPNGIEPSSVQTEVGKESSLEQTGNSSDTNLKKLTTDTPQVINQGSLAQGRYNLRPRPK